MIKKGLSREDAYSIVQPIAMKAWKDNNNFQSIIKKNKNVTTILNENEIDTLFDLRKVMKNINKIYKRLGL